MSEYITEWCGSEPSALRREEIVRCRDCKYAIAHACGCGRTGDFFDVDPDGFCAWGEKAVNE